MLNIMKHSESAEDAVHILQDITESFEEEGSREHDVINLKRSDATDVTESGEELQEVRTAASLVSYTQCRENVGGGWF